jgi:AraC-like DNA-binding protein
MSYQIAKPSKILAPFVKQYWTVENCLKMGDKVEMRIVPTGLHEMSFYFSGKPNIISSNETYPGNAFISGQKQTFHDIEMCQSLQLFSVTFQPHAIKTLFNVPANQFLNANVALQQLASAEMRELEETLATNSSFKQRINSMEHFLFQKLKKNASGYVFNRIDDSIGQINAFKGIISIEDLASRACLSIKQYERTFMDYVGTPPKQFLRIVRFQYALYLKQTGYSQNLTMLACDCGYFDQAHMTNDFKKLSGFTPKQYFAECEAQSDYFF